MNEAKLIAEMTVLTEMVRVLSDKMAEMEAKMKLALEALELMYACYAHPEWISHKQQEEKILAQCVATSRN